jgi:hypothetical protein
VPSDLEKNEWAIFGRVEQVFKARKDRIKSFYGFDFRKNRIYFRRIRQDQKEKIAARKERIEKLLWMIAGTIIGVIGTLIEGYLKH